MLRLLVYAMIGFILWKLVRLFFSMVGHSRTRNPEPPPEFPQDISYKNIEDADFEDISSDPDKPS